MEQRHQKLGGCLALSVVMKIEAKNKNSNRGINLGCFTVSEAELKSPPEAVVTNIMLWLELAVWIL